MVQIALAEGITDMLPTALANFGAALLASGDPLQAFRPGKLSLLLIHKMNATGCEATVNIVVQGFIAWVS